jgi:hypothetical protein
MEPAQRVRLRFRKAIDSGGEIQLHTLTSDLGRGPEDWCCIHVGRSKLTSLPRADVLTALYGAELDWLEATEDVH